MTNERDISRMPGGEEVAPGVRTAPTGYTPYRDDAHAVVIGINRYADPRIRDLRYARADAEAVYAVLTNPEVGRFKPENVTLLVDADAHERGIRKAIGDQLPRRAASEHTVVIYYAGHGAPVIDPKARSADGMEKYLIPHDADAEHLRSTAISMEDIHRFFGWIVSKQVLFFLDSCYSGGAGGRSFDPPGFQTRAKLSEEFLEHLGDEGRFVVTACATNEVSLETPELQHGLFTYHLIEGLRGKADADRNGLVTIDELYEYLYRNVEREARLLGGSMRPVRKGSLTGTVYLTQYETEERRRARELSDEALAAYHRGELEEATRLWEEVVQLDPKLQRAREGLKAVADRRAEERRKIEKEEGKRREALERKQRLLLHYRRGGGLSVPEFAQAMELLEKDAQQLTRREKEIRDFIDHLIRGDISVSAYVRSIELLSTDQEPPSRLALDGPPESGTAPAEQESHLEAEPKAHEAGRRRQADRKAKRRADTAGQKRRGRSTAGRQADQRRYDRTKPTLAADAGLRRRAAAKRGPLDVPLAGHTGPVRSVAFSPGGTILASGSEDSTVRLWDVATHHPLGEPLAAAGNECMVRSVAFSPDGTTLACGALDKHISLWDVETRRFLGELLANEEGGVVSVAFSPHGTMLASGSWDGRIRLWDVPTRRPIGDPLSPPGFTATWDGRIPLWDPRTGRPIGGLFSPSGFSVTSVAFGPDGTTLASGIYNGTIRFWDVATRRAIGTTHRSLLDLVRYRDGVASVAFSPDGATLASAGWCGHGPQGRIRLWDVATRRPLGAPFAEPVDWVESVAFNHDGTILASGSKDGTVSLWDVTTRRPIGEPLAGHTDEVRSVAFSPGGTILASGGADKTIRLWHLGSTTHG